MNDSSNKKIVASLLDGAYLEVIPTPSIMDQLVHIRRHHRVGISCSPAHGVEPTLRLAENLRALPEEHQLKVIPHIAARMISMLKLSLFQAETDMNPLAPTVIP